MCKLDPVEVLNTLLHAPSPIVSPHFYSKSAAVNFPGNQLQYFLSSNNPEPSA